MRFKKKAPLLVLGVALFTALFTVNNQKTKTANASTDIAFATLTFPDGNSKGISNYTSTWTATIGNYTWSISNFNNNNNGWAYIRAGSKNNASTATIKNSAVYEEVVSSIVVSIGKYTSGMINYVSLTSTDSSGNEFYTSKITDLSEAGITDTSGGDLTF